MSYCGTNICKIIYTHQEWIRGLAYLEKTGSRDGGLSEGGRK